MMHAFTTQTNPWQEVYDAIVTNALQSLQVVYDEFNISLQEWLNDILNHPIPEDWRGEVARFVQQTERNGLEILPESIAVIEAIIESCIAGTDEFAEYGPAPRGPARAAPPTQTVASVAIEAATPPVAAGVREADEEPAKVEPASGFVGYPAIPSNRRYFRAQPLFDEKLASAKQHLDELERLLKAAGDKIDAAKPDEEVDLGYEAEMVQKHLFLYNEDLAVARDLWLRFNLSGDGNSALIAMHTPAGLGLPMFASPAQAERARQQGLAISRRLNRQNASMDAVVTTVATVEVAANAASIVAGAGALIVAAKKGGTWAVVKTVAVGYAIYMDTKIAEVGLQEAGASEQAIRGIQLAAAAITLILLRRVPKTAAPQKPAQTPGKPAGGITGIGANSPGADGGTPNPHAAVSGIQIVEQEGSTVIASFKVAGGEAKVIGDVVREGDAVIIRGAHIQGDATLKEVLDAARRYGREQGVKRVIIEGARRTTGANPGHVPKTITVEVK